MNYIEEQDNKVKHTLLKMFAWFHDFCEVHNLRYYVIGGTMLGAVRHQGFIPWDDDIDVGMPRADYRKLEALMGDKNSRYVLETPNSPCGDYFYPYSKLYDTQTTLVENTRYKIKRGIFIDIFPLDGTGNEKEESFFFFKSVKRRRNLLLTVTTGIRAGRSLYKNAAVVAMRCVPNFVLDKKKLLLSVDRMSAQRDFDQCEWVGNLMGNWMEREIMPRSVMGKPTAYTFENLTVWGPEDYDGYLTSLYGNWRELPPVEKRKSHHDFLYIDLEHSYLA